MEQLITSIQNIFANAVDGMSYIAIVLLGFLCVVLVLAIVYFIRIHIAYAMAKKRHRDPLGWALFSFFVSPIVTWIILLIAGNARHDE